MIGHEYLKAAHDDVDMDARGRFGNLCLGEVKLDGAHDTGDFSALKLAGVVALIGLAHRDGDVEVALGTRAGFGGLRALPFTLLLAFATALALAVVTGATRNDGNADEDDGDGPDVGPFEHIEQHELNDRRDGDQHDWARRPFELLHHEQINAPQDEQGRDVGEELSDAVYGDCVQRHEQQQDSDDHYENPEEYAAFHDGVSPLRVEGGGVWRLYVRDVGVSKGGRRGENVSSL